MLIYMNLVAANKKLNLAIKFHHVVLSTSCLVVLDVWKKVFSCFNCLFKMPFFFLFSFQMSCLVVLDAMFQLLIQLLKFFSS